MPSPCLQSLRRAPGDDTGPRNFTADQRRSVYERLLSVAVSGRPPHGSFRAMSTLYGCHWKTISRIWDQAKRSLATGAIAADTAAKICGKTFNRLYFHVSISCYTIIKGNGFSYLGNSGRKPIRTHDEIEASVRAISHHKRQTLRSLASSVNIPNTTIMRHMKAVARLKARSSYVKPLLTEDNQKSIEIQGNNDYKLPHMKKDKTINNLSLFNVECNSSTYEDALVHVTSRVGDECHLESLMNSLE